VFPHRVTKKSLKFDDREDIVFELYIRIVVCYFGNTLSWFISTLSDT